MILNESSRACALLIICVLLFDLYDSLSGRLVLLYECTTKDLIQLDIQTCVKDNPNESKLHFNINLNNYVVFLVINLTTLFLLVDNLLKDSMLNEISDNLYEKKILIKVTIKCKVGSVAKGLWISVLIWTQVIMKELEYSATGILLNDHLYFSTRFASKILILLLYLVCILSLMLVYVKSELNGINKINVMSYPEINEVLNNNGYKLISIDVIIKRQNRILNDKCVLYKIIPHFNFGDLRKLLTFNNQYEDIDSDIEDLIGEARNLGLDFKDEILSLEVKF